MIDAARAKSAAIAATAELDEPSVGDLPSWNLGDLYAGLDDPKLRADLRRADADAVAFEDKYKGKVVALAEGANGGAALAAAVLAFEALEDLLGRIVSYAGLVHAENTSDPVRSKFYGDVAEKITAASAHMLFFGLELNRIPDAILDKAMEAPALGHYRPWIEDVRKEKPYQLEDRVELLFHEKSTTAFSAWNRLFDETISTLRFTLDGKELSIESTLNFLQDNDEKKRKAAAEALATTFEKNIRLFTHITNTLAKDKEISDRWRGFKDVAGSRHLANRVEPEVVDALVAAVRAAHPRLSHRYYKLKAKWFGRETLNYIPTSELLKKSVPLATPITRPTVDPRTMLVRTNR